VRPLSEHLHDCRVRRRRLVWIAIEVAVILTAGALLGYFTVAAEPTDVQCKEECGMIVYYKGRVFTTRDSLTREDFAFIIKVERGHHA